MYKSLYEQNNNYKIFLDMDGVLCDFILHFKNSFGVELKQGEYIQGKYIYPKIKSVPHWWKDIPWMPDGKYLLNKCRQFSNDVCLLTTPAYENSVPTCKQDKIDWVKKEIGDIEVIFSFHKEQYASQTSILIDDKKENTNKFNDAGGIGIFYNNTKDTIYQLKELFK
jgi:hypothetical protein